MAREGLRTLVVAKRALTEEQYQDFEVSRPRLPAPSLRLALVGSGVAVRMAVPAWVTPRSSPGRSKSVRSQARPLLHPAGSGHFFSRAWFPVLSPE